MSTHYIYLDETGTLDFQSQIGDTYFGIGSAHLSGSHPDELWSGHALRMELENTGVPMPKGLHASRDSHLTRAATFGLIGMQAWRFDSTFLRKDSSAADVLEKDKLRLYKYVLSQHLMRVIEEIATPNDNIVIFVANLVLTKRKMAVREVVDEVCAELRLQRSVTSHIWDSTSAWGLQVVDYALWRIRRTVECQTEPDYMRRIDHQLMKPRFPWGK